MISIYDKRNTAEQMAVIRKMYDVLKNEIYTQDHDYMLMEGDSSAYSYDKVALYFQCKVCNCLLVMRNTPGYLSFKYNSKYVADIVNDVGDKHKFLTCKENIIKNIIQ